MNHLSTAELTLLYYDEPQANTAGTERAHLAECLACRAEWERLSRFLDALRDIPLPEPDAAWDAQLWAKLAPRIAPDMYRRSHQPWWRRPWLVVPAFAALFAAAFLAGMFTAKSKGPAPFTPEARERVLLITLGDHLDRSEIVLAELVHAPAGGQTDISEQQQLAGSLLNENRLLRQTAARSGDPTQAALLDELERVLLDVAHAPAEVSPAELDRLRARIEAQGLLFKVRVIRANAREKGMKL